MTHKVYDEDNNIVYLYRIDKRGNKVLIQAFGRLNYPLNFEECKEYFRRSNIEIPPRAWLCSSSGVVSIETKAVYANDNRQFIGWIGQPGG